MSEDAKPKKKLEMEKGGSGRKGRTAIGSGENGGSDDFPTRPSSSGQPHAEKRPRTVLCDRSQLIRRGFSLIIEPVAEVIAEAADVRSALEIIKCVEPELVLLDLDLDSFSGLDVVRSNMPSNIAKPRFLVFTDSYYATKYYHRLLRAGVAGICLKSSEPDILIETIEKIFAGYETACDYSIADLVRQSLTPEAFLDYSLWEDDLDVLVRLDLRNKEIAEELDMKLRSVEHVVERILENLQVPSRTAAALKAVQLGFTLLPKISRCDETGKSEEQKTAERYAQDAIDRLG